MAAFTTALAIGSAMARGPVVVSALPAAHVEWCYARYRSYRASDNTFAPRVGIRAACHSPYY
jgi:hypothetical protein